MGNQPLHVMVVYNNLPIYCSTCPFIQYISGCLREIGSNGEIGIMSIDAKITQTTNPIVNNIMTKTIGIMVNVILKYLPIALFISNNHPEMYSYLYPCS